MMSGSYGWGLPGFLVAAVFMVACVVLMGRMMGHGRMSNHRDHMNGPGRQTSAPYGADVVEQDLELRLVNGEIDFDEYNRLRDALAEISSTGRERAAQAPLTGGDHI